MADKQTDSQERKTVRLPIDVYKDVRVEAFKDEIPIVRWIANAVAFYKKHRERTRGRSKK